MDLEVKKKMITHVPNLSISRQCELMVLSRATYYYKPRLLEESDYKIMRVIDEIFTEHPYYGARRMSQILKKEGYNIGRKKIKKGAVPDKLS